MKSTQCLVLTSFLLACGGIRAVPAQEAAAVAERVAALKAVLETSQVALKQYEWIETTVVSLKGEEKSRKQERCYHGADGGLQKVEANRSPEPEKKRGLRGRIVERKQEQLTDYMRSAVGLVRSYVPPMPAQLEAVKAAGRVSIDVLEPGKRVRLNFRDYDKPGDNLGVEIDLVNNRPLGLTVSTYIDDPKDAVTLDVRMDRLDDGTLYPAISTLVAKAKEIDVTVRNSGYRKVK
jgi:hypothetical protein